MRSTSFSTGRSSFRRRRRARGAAMVEAIVTIPFFIIIFVSIIFVGRLYRSKMKTHRESMASAWQKSVLGCDPALTGPIPGTPSIDLGAAKDAPGAQLCDSSVGQIKESVNGSAAASGALGGFSASTTTTTKLVCNERPTRGDFEGAFDFLWDLFKPPEAP